MNRFRNSVKACSSPACSLTESFIASHSIATLLQWVRLSRWPEPLKTERFFRTPLMKGQELHVLKPLNLSGFGFPSLENSLCLVLL